MKHKSQRGVALVITLIMLAIVTVMAVLFLGTSRRERSSVTLSKNLTDAKLAADAGQARALSEVVARITAHSNLFAYNFLVSTNFINPNGFTPNLSSLMNVSYVYAGTGQPLNRDADIRQNQTNLYYDPRPPVFVVTNLTSGASEFRFYLDLNRNGRFDTNGVQRIFDTNGVITPATALLVGDPEWIGILEHPDWPHSSSNQFIGRYAFVVVPAGKTLDINYSHNNARNPGVSRPVTPDFFRNQGGGSWEINLAAFFRELNTNTWNANSYSYNPANNIPSGGPAFIDALSILTNRYQSRWTSLKSVDQAFGLPIGTRFRNDQIDEYSDGPLMTGIKLPKDADNTALPWSGSDNTNGFVNIFELFDTNKVSTNLVNGRLRPTLVSPGTYNQNTFYRLMAQLGTDSLPANRHKLNLNYDNVNLLTGQIDPSAVAGFTNWTPLRFFTNAVSQLLVAAQFTDPQFTNLVVTNANGVVVPRIPIYPTNYYAASVHRLLQLAANIGDATTNRFQLSTGSNIVYAPSVFRPSFTNDGKSIFIAGYQEVFDTNFLKDPWLDLNNQAARNAIIPPGTIKTNVNVYGIPLVIGAKKGLPNFNEFLLQSDVQVSRRLQARKDRTFQQAYEIGISNYFALEAWNSYTQACPMPLTMMIVTNQASLILTNENNPPFSGPMSLAFTNIGTSFTTNFLANTWNGREFRQPLNHLEIFVPDSEFHFQPPFLRRIQNGISFDLARNDFRVPNWKLIVTNRVVYALVAKDLSNTPRLVDFVNPGNMVGGMDIARALVGATNIFGDNQGQDFSGIFWLTNRIASGAVNSYTAPPSSTRGITNQLYVSLNDVLTDRDWNSYSKNQIDGDEKKKAIDGFRKFMGLPPIFYPNDKSVPTETFWQVPFTPTRKLDQQLSWQVNDPLVHYTLQDLYDRFYTDTNNVQALLPRQSPPDNNIRKVNLRYRPWGGKPGKDPSDDASARDLALKDPLITQSDDWDFPTNKFPNLGWLGRVHRGTPWQTVYLKASVEPTNNWATWSGSAGSHPTNDWHLVGLFTTALNDNAARGLLSVNQTNSAAWSAVLGGVSVLTNLSAKPQSGAGLVYTNLFVEPASAQLAYIVSNINATRLQMPNQAFPDLGSVLASPALTTNSPYLNLSPDQTQYGIRDEVYERIPQQILSLLKEDEPYVVIYAFGQSLRPAENSIVRTPGPYRGLCTNYQVTGEVVTKTAVRIENPKSRIYKAVVESYNVLPAD